MNYENLDNQSSDAQEALKFLPSSMLQAAIHSKDPALGRLKKDTLTRPKKDQILKSSNKEVLPKDINYGQLDLNLQPITTSRELEEKRNTMIATGLGTGIIVFLIYILFLR